MKYEAFDHPKMKRLCRKLDLRLYQAVGILEAIWQVTQIKAPTGDIGRLSNSEIIRAIDYRLGAADELINALIETGWLDRDKKHRLIVHDWADHIDDHSRAY